MNSDCICKNKTGKYVNFVSANVRSNTDTLDMWEPQFKAL